MYLMLGDNKVLYFDLEDFVVQVLNEDLVPFCMRYAFKKGDKPQDLLYNIQLIKSYLGNMVLSLSRDNAKQIFALFKIPQLNTLDVRVNVCLRCRGVSIQDSYWIKDDDSVCSFEDVNIRHKHFKEIVDISLLGDNPTITTSPLCPELTTHGLFRKAWIRESGVLYLLKSDNHVNNINTKMEVLSSKILKCFSNKIDCVEYTGRYRSTAMGRIFVDKCKSFGNDEYSFVEAWELIDFCSRQGISFRDKILGYSKESASIGVLDFILSNTDRHTQNYGFWMRNTDGVLSGIAPLFDFNCALVSDFFYKDASDTLSQMFNDGMTLRQVANLYQPYSRLILDKAKFNRLKSSNREYSYIFDNILERCKKMNVCIR